MKHAHKVKRYKVYVHRSTTLATVVYYFIVAYPRLCEKEKKKKEKREGPIEMWRESFPLVRT